ncbi:MAG: DEAD/DEAH box helicase [Lachnospiraceae bacterium]|nr:DEAD/DEAH box helicase [Lachnospiraceae bacterium]
MENMENTENNEVQEVKEEATANLFENLDLSKELKKALNDMEFVEMTAIQSQSIPAMIAGNDIVAQAPTGTGKTCSFGIPVVENTDTSERNVTSLILAPTRELALQIANELIRLTKYKKSIRIAVVYGGQNIDRQILALKRKPQIIVATPGRLMDHMRRKTIRLDHLKTLVLDEADEMLDMGFREDIDEILQSVPEERQTVLFSATMSREILDITKKYLKDPVKIKTTKSEVTVSSVKQYYLEVSPDNKTDVLARLIDVNDFKLSMVFCNTKKKVDELAHDLTVRGYNAMGLHGDMKQSQRDRVMREFKNGNIETLIATDVAARGIDIKDIDVVFNYDLPDDMEYYVHRIGRTGRANREGVSYSLVSRREMYRLHEIMRYTKAKIKLMTIPNVAEITNVRIQQTLNGILDVLSHQKLDTYEQAILDFVENTDDAYTILNVAAAFLARDSDTGELKEIEENFSSDRRRCNSRSGNPNATRMFINVGRLDRVNVNTMRKLLNDANITDEEIYDIDIMEKFSFIEIDNSKVDDVFVALNGIMMNGRRVNTEISNTKKRNNNSRSNGRDGRRSSEGRDNRRSSGGNSNRDSSRRRYED